MNLNLNMSGVLQLWDKVGSYLGDLNLGNLRLRTKIPLYFVGLAGISILLVAVISNQMTQASLEKEAISRLTATSQGPAKALDNVLDNLKADITSLSVDQGVLGAMRALGSTYHKTPNPTETLQAVYIDNNTYPVGQKQGLSDGGTGSTYDAAHRNYHPTFATRLAQMGYYDIFLIDMHGNIVYTVFKERDFATNLKTGAWKYTGLATVWKSATESTAYGEISFVDFAAYSPSHGVPAAFVAMPILDDNGSKMGVLVIQMPLGKINQAMDGDGHSDVVSYLVGSDQFMRSDLQSTPKDDTLNRKMENPAVAAALKGEVGSAIYTDHNGVEVIGSYLRIDFFGSQWAVVSEQPSAMVYAAANSIRNWIALVGIAVMLGTLFIARFLSDTITKPISDIQGSMGAIARENLTAEIANTERFDEIGDMSRALASMRESLLLAKQNAERAEQERTRRLQEQREAEKAEFARQAEAKRLEQERIVVQHQEEERLRQQHDQDRKVMEAAQQQVVANICEALDKLAKGDLGATIDGGDNGAHSELRTYFMAAVDSLRTIVASISRSSSAIRNNVDEISGASSNLAQRTEASAYEIATTAATMTQMTGLVAETTNSILSVQKLTEEMTRQVNQSMESAQDTETAMRNIEQSATQISKIVGVIDDIAFQTNLLALNAGVEAARAGESGRGFAVVASEVRALAQRASGSASEIGELLAASTQHVINGVALVRSSGESLRAIAESVSTIADQVVEISARAEEQQKGIAEANASIEQLDRATQSNAAMSEETSAATLELAESSRELFELVRAFKGWQDAPVHFSSTRAA